MRIVYLANTQIPSRATNGMQIMRMCAAFAAQGVDVTLVHPHRFGNRPEGYAGDVWAFYGVPESFRLVTLPTPLTLGLSNFKRFARLARGVPLSSWVLGRSRPGAEPFIAYSRSMLGAWLAIESRRFWRNRSACRGVYVEVHDAPSTPETWRTLARADGIVAISAALRDRLVAVCPSLADRTFVEHDGVDLDRFSSENAARSEIRRRLRLDAERAVVGYTGRVNADKGVPTLFEAARKLQGSPVSFLVVGKVYDNLEATANSLESVRLVGFVPPSEVPGYVAAADMLVMPTSARIPYAEFTSPLKLFEYMASGRPVIASDLPVLREVLTHERNALLFRADDADSLCETIGRLRDQPQLGESLAKQAAADVVEFAWDQRARRLLNVTKIHAQRRLHR